MHRPALLRRPLRTVAEVVAVGLIASQGLLVFGAMPANAGGTFTVTPRAAIAAGPTINEFRPTGISATASSDVVGITTGPDGNLWFTDSGASRIGTITTSGSGFKEFGTPTPNATPEDIISADGNLWFTEFSSSASQIGRVTTGGSANEFAIQTGAGPNTLVLGPDGNLWFTNYLNSTIGRLSPTAAAGTVAQEFPVADAGTNPTDITVGSDGNLWYTEGGANGSKIGVMNTSGAKVASYSATTSAGGVGISGITLGPDGNVWYTEQNAGKIGKMTPAGAITEYSVGGSNPGPSAIVTVGANLWFVDQSGNAIGEITPSGAVTEYAVPTPNAFSADVSPVGLTLGPDGNLWFTEQDAHSAISELVLSSVGSGGGTTGGGGGSTGGGGGNTGGGGGNTGGGGGGGGGGCTGGGLLGILGLVQSLLSLLGLGGAC